MAHAIPNKVEAACKRGQILAKRRKQLEAWASYLDGTRLGKVILLRAGGTA